MIPDAAVRVECPWCGSLTLPPQAVRCAEAAGDRLALCEFNCPICSRLIIIRITPEGFEAARRIGVAPLEGPIPRELLEARDGPPLTWDDLLDLHLAVTRTPCPQGPLLAPGHEAAAGS